MPYAIAQPPPSQYVPDVPSPVPVPDVANVPVPDVAAPVLAPVPDVAAPHM